LRYDDAPARSDETAEMLILRNSVKWRAPGKHFGGRLERFPSLTKASHAVDSPVKNTLSLQENTALNRVRNRAQVEHVDQI
jgi:hypothetical protein